MDHLIQDFISGFKSNTLNRLCYNSKMDLFNYGILKVILTRIQSRQNYPGKHIFMYSVCPGYSATDINGHDPNARLYS